MKKLVFGLIATVMLSVSSFGQDFNSFGLEHNRMLKKVISKYDKNINNSNVFDITKSIVNSTFPEYNSNSIFNFKSYTTPLTMLDEIYTKKIISKELYNVAKTDLNNISNMQNSNEITSYVENARLDSKKLPVNDFQIYLNFLSTLKHSSIFWIDVIDNGTILMGDGTPIIPNPGSQTNSVASKLPDGWRWKYWASDAVGALCGGPMGALCASACYAISIL